MKNKKTATEVEQDKVVDQSTEKEAEIKKFLSEVVPTNINQQLAIWALNEAQKDEHADVDSVIASLNQASECIVTLYNFFKKENAPSKDMLKQTLYDWAKKEPTNLEYKAKYR